MLKQTLRPYCSSDLTATAAAGMVTGVGATVVSQGFDTLKTLRQAAKANQALSFKDAAKKLYASQGAVGFFKGGVPRGARVMMAVNLLGTVSEAVQSSFTKL